MMAVKVSLVLHKSNTHFNYINKDVSYIHYTFYLFNSDFFGGVPSLTKQFFLLPNQWGKNTMYNHMYCLLHQS